MDKSLDDIIASRPKGNRKHTSGRARTARSQVLGAAPAARARYATAIPSSNNKIVATTAQPADKIIVSNLPPDVNEAQIKELFHSTVGPLKDVTLHYDPSGRSKGVASVHFSRKGDGTKAYQQYNSRLIDGKRPMKIEIVVDPVNLPSQSLASRVAPAPISVGTTEGGVRRGGPRRARGRGSGRRKGDRPAKSVADLDAEMEDYTASNAPAVATA